MGLIMLNRKESLAVGLIMGIVFLSSAVTIANGPAVQTPPDIRLETKITPERAVKGRAVRTEVVVVIPEGYHANANKPLSKFAIPTKLDVAAPQGVQLTPVRYPAGRPLKFEFSEDRIAVYEGRTPLRFNVTIPAGYSGSTADIRVKLRYQSCNDSVCFPPDTREAIVSIPVE